MSLLSNGLSGLIAAQHVLNVASQNIANVNTPGYSRQEAVLNARLDGSNSRLSPGAGVEVASLRRVADDYLTASLWRASNQSGYDSQLETLLGQLESIIGSDEMAITSSIDSFFAALNAAATDPQSIAARDQVLATADTLSTRFQQLMRNLELQERQINEQSAALVDNINSLAQTLSVLNQRIMDAQAKGGNTSQLEDQRDLALKELSQYVDVRTQRLSDGSISITLSGGQPLVMGSKSASFALEQGNLSLQFKGQTFPVSKAGGQLGALQDYQNQNLTSVRASLNEQAKTIAQAINDQLQQGYDLEGNPGAPLFSYDPSSPASTIDLNPAITAKQLAFTGSPDAGKGDNGNLLKIVNMKNGFYDAYSGLIGSVGIASGQAQAQAQASRNLLQDAQHSRDSVSGVNQDEEAIRLMNFLQAYQANAKVVSAANSIFDTLLGIF